MLIRRTVMGGALISVTLMGNGMAHGQDYPNKPIRLVTGAGAGGTDVVVRLIAQGMTGALGQNVIVDNRVSGAITGETVSRAQPDGYTLLVVSSVHWIAPLMQKMPYDPVADFSPITLASRAPEILVVHPSLAVTSVRELIGLAKAKPGALNYSSGQTGSAPHLAAELFKAMADVNIVRIPYKGGSLVSGAVVSGEVQLSFPSAASVIPLVKSGRLRALAVTGAEPSALAPGLPTVAGAGLPGYESEVMCAVFAPAKTPATIVQRLNQEIAGFLKTPVVREKLFYIGAEVAGSTPQQLSTLLKSEMARMGKVIRDAGIRAE